MSFLDDLPLASVIAIAAVICIVWGYIDNEIDLDTALTSLGAVLGGAGLLGHARNGAGRGMRK